MIQQNIASIGSSFTPINHFFSLFCIDIVLNHRLVETGFGDKKGFTGYLKTYMKKVVAHLEENDRKDEVDEFKANIQKVMKDLMGRFKDLQFFTGKTLFLKPPIFSSFLGRDWANSM